MEPEFDPLWWVREDAEDLPQEHSLAPNPDVSYNPAHFLGYKKDPYNYFRFRKSYRCPGAQYPKIAEKAKFPPPKREEDRPEEERGGWDHLIFVPEWTDPDWVDPAVHGGTGEANDDANPGPLDDPVRPVRTVPVDRILRPAQLAQDEVRNPTPYARRFGIGPGRTDGRSGLSPTSEVHKQFPATGETLAAEEAVNRLRALAAQRDVGPSQLLEELTRPSQFSQLNEADQFVVRFNNEIQQDRDWQSMLYEDVTTDELLREGIFGITDDLPGKPLENELHDLVDRYRWRLVPKCGSSREKPRYMYNVNGRRGTWDLCRDNFLWERIEPALRLASRMLEHCLLHDPWWKALLNPLKHTLIDPSRDPRSKNTRDKYPATSFSTLEPEKDEVLEGAAEVQEMVDGRKMTLKSLGQLLYFTVAGGFHGERRPGEIWGETHAAGFCQGSEENEIRIQLSGDLLFPLLVDGYSQSERYLAQHSVAMTVLHEIAHAVDSAQMAWVGGSYEDADLQEALDQVDATRFTCAFIEPFFEMEQRSELGHSMESHLCGGTCWTYLSESLLDLRYLENVPCGLALLMWPHGFDAKRNGEKNKKSKGKYMVLNTPPLRYDDYRIATQLSQVASIFTEEFWDSEITKYGSAALYVAPMENARVCTRPGLRAHTEWRDELSKLGVSEEDLDRAFGHLADDDGNGEVLLLRRFFDLILIETFSASCLLEKWTEEVVATRERVIAMDHLNMQCGLLVRQVQLAQHISGGQNILEQPEKFALRLNGHKGYIDALKAASDRLSSLPKDVARKFHPPSGITAETTLQDFWAALPRAARNAQSGIQGRVKQGYAWLKSEVAVFQTFFSELWGMTYKNRQTFLKSFLWGYEEAKSPISGHLASFKKACAMLLGLCETCRGPVIDTWIPKLQAIDAEFDQLLEWAADLTRVPGGDWGRLLLHVQDIKRCQQPASSRWMRMAKKEIKLLGSEDIVQTEHVLELLGSLGSGNETASMIVEPMDIPRTPAEAQACKVDPLKPMKDLAEAWQKMEWKFKESPPAGVILQPTSVGPPSSNPGGKKRPATDDEDDPWQDSQKKKRRAGDNDSESMVTASSVWQTASQHAFGSGVTMGTLPSLNNPNQPHVQSFNVGLKAPKIKGFKYPNLPVHYPFDSPLPGGATGSNPLPFPFAVPGQRFSEPGNGPQAFPGAAQGTSHPPDPRQHWADRLPVSRGIFPHPYSLSGNTTADLEKVDATAGNSSDQGGKLDFKSPAFQTPQDTDDEDGE